jgi:hypothetical protein
MELRNILKGDILKVIEIALVFLLVLGGPQHTCVTLRLHARQNR